MSARAVVVDDEDLARKRMCTLVAEHEELELVGEAATGAEALDLIVAAKPDIAFLDIQMPELDGLEVVQALDDDALPAVVFVTAFDQYAIDAFEVGAIDYLLKPVTEERFRASVARVLRRIAGQESPQRLRDMPELTRERGYASRLVARRGNRHYFVRSADLEWLEAEGNYLRLHAAGATHLVRLTMKEAEARLDPAAFVRIHRSTMVALDRIASIEVGDSGEYVVTTTDGTRHQSSRSYSPRIRSLLR